MARCYRRITAIIGYKQQRRGQGGKEISWVGGMGVVGCARGCIALGSVSVSFAYDQTDYRVTLEYSTLHSSNIIPPNLHRAMSVPTSSGVSAFLVSRDSANFFDLLERLDGVWAGSRVESWVLGAGAGANSDGGRMRLVGGVPS